MKFWCDQINYHIFEQFFVFLKSISFHSFYCCGDGFYTLAYIVSVSQCNRTETIPGPISWTRFSINQVVKLFRQLSTVSAENCCSVYEKYSCKLLTTASLSKEVSFLEYRHAIFFRDLWLCQSSI